MSQLISTAALCLYILGLLASLLHFSTKKQTLFRLALWSVSTAFLLHTLSLILLGLSKKHFPLTTPHESFSFFAWAITVSFFLAYFRYRIKALGAFVLPLATTLLLFAGLAWDDQKPFPPNLRGIWLYVHTSLAFLAYAAFFVTFISAIMYLIQEHELKSKRLSLFYYRLPSLEVCDDLSYKSLIIGFILMTLGIITGAFWAELVWGRYWVWDPKVISASITWLIYFVLIHYRWTKGWRGRRSAYISIVGFLAILFTFLGAPYFKGLHVF